MEAIRVSELSIKEFKQLVKEVLIEVLKDMDVRIEVLDVPYVSDEEQKELEGMFGKNPDIVEFVYKKEIEV